MNKSIQEEVLCALYAIAAILCFSNGWIVFGYVFAIKSVSDLMCALFEARQEIKRRLKVWKKKFRK